MKRRQFLQGAAGTTVLSTAALTTQALSTDASAADRVPGAAERVHLGLIGCGGRGRLVADHMRKIPGVQFDAVCDVYDQRLLRMQAEFGPRCQAFRDLRKLLDQEHLDAVVVATPDHWHAIATVLACRAGKDVYVEKPLAHNVREGRAIVEAARRHRRVVQTGTQQRSAPHFDRVRRIIQSGELGDVHYVRIWNFANLTPEGIGKEPDSPVPPGVGWDMYLGPAPRVPFNRNRFVNSYRYFWDYAGGKITDWGVHRFDSMHQVLGVDAPRTVSAAGGRFALDDDGEVPDVHQVTYEYPGLVVSYEACHLNAHGLGGRTPGKRYYRANGPDDRPNGLAFYGTRGALFADRLGFEIYPELKPGEKAADRGAVERFRMERQEAFGPESVGPHVENFLRCVRTRQRPAADVEIGHRSTIVAHLGNIALKVGRRLKWDLRAEQILDDEEANRMLGREARKPWDLI